MTRFAVLLAALTTTLSLAAAQSGQEKQGTKYKPFEIQLGASFMGYGKHKATGPQGVIDFEPDGLKLAPSLRLTIEPFTYRFVSWQFSAGLRAGNDVPLEYDGGKNANADMKHKGQAMLGTMLRFEINDRFDVGVGIDARNDWMDAKGRYNGSDSDASVWRGWVRANARYLFDKPGRDWTPFVGVEAAFALEKAKIDSRNYYRDYYINTGWPVLGEVDTTLPSPQSFTRGHAPIWEVALVAGVRFGRSGGCAVTPPVAPKAPVVEDTPRPVPVVDTPKPPVDTPKPVEETKPPLVKDPEFIEVDGLRVFFLTDVCSEGSGRSLVRNWVNKYKGTVAPEDIMIIGHADQQKGPAGHNQRLSERRAQRLRTWLAEEGFNVPQANVSGRDNRDLLAPENTRDGRARNRRAEATVVVKVGGKYKHSGKFMEDKPLPDR